MDLNNPYSSRVIHPEFCPIHPLAKIGKNVRVGHYVVVEEDCVIGDDCFLGNFVMVRAGVIIGNNCVIGHGTVLEAGCKLGNRVTVHVQCYITKGVIIEDDVFLGPGSTTINTRRIKHTRDFPLVIQAPYIKRAARLGAQSLILPGVTVGENAFVRSGSVVSKDIPDRTIVAGVPARMVGPVDEEDILK